MPFDMCIKVTSSAAVVGGVLVYQCIFPNCQKWIYISRKIPKNGYLFLRASKSTGALLPEKKITNSRKNKKSRRIEKIMKQCNGAWKCWLWLHPRSFWGLCPLDPRAVGLHLFGASRQAAQMLNLTENLYLGLCSQTAIFFFYALLFLPKGPLKMGRSSEAPAADPLLWTKINLSTMGSSLLNVS